MPYIGHNPTNAGSFVEIDSLDASFNGNTTAFTLNVGGVAVTPTIENLLVILDGVVQQPTGAFTLSGSTLTFTEAPVSGTDGYIILMGQSASIGGGTITADELAVNGDGTAGQLLKSDGDGTFTWLNQNAITGITSLGTIGTGVWQGTPITSAYLNPTQTAITSVGTLTGLTILGDEQALTVKTADSGRVAIALQNSDTGSATNFTDGLLIKLDSDETGHIGMAENKALSLFTNGTTAMTIDSSQRVGIGISSSITDPLHVKTSAVETRISLESSTGKWAIGAEDNDKFGILNYGTSTPFIIDSSGNVGIGATSISATDWGNASPVVQISGTQPLLSFKETDATKEFQLALSGGYFYLYDADNSATRLLITDDGNVLVGGVGATFGDLGIENAGDSRIDLFSNVGSGTRGKAEIFFSTDSSSDHVSCASIVMEQPPNDESARKGQIAFKVSDGGAPAQAVLIENNLNTTFNGTIASENFSSETAFGGDVDTLKRAGFYRIENSASNMITGNYYSMIVAGNGSNVTSQWAVDLLGGQTYTRSFNTSWTSWVRIDD